MSPRRGQTFVDKRSERERKKTVKNSHLGLGRGSQHIPYQQQVAGEQDDRLIGPIIWALLGLSGRFLQARVLSGMYV